MRIAIGYCWFSTAAGYHLERALRAADHEVDYVGLASAERPGYGETTPVDAIAGHMAKPPDLYLWIDPSGRYFPRGIENLPCLTACYLIDVHLGTWREQVARFFDIVLVAQKDYVERFRRAVGHDQVYWLPLAAAADVHRMRGLPKTYDIGFVGNMALAHRKTERARRLKLLSARFRMNDFHRQYSPEELSDIYSRAHIVFNTSIAGDVTMRVFEGAACGAMVLTDSVRNGLGELFDIGREIVTYKDDADLVDKVAFYLAHPLERDAIARAGHERVIKEHTYRHRAETIAATALAPDVRRCAPMRMASAGEQSAARRVIYTHMHMVDAVLDETRSTPMGPLSRAGAVLPVLVRRLLI